MHKYHFVIHRGDAGQRLDQYLVKRLPHFISRSYLQKLIKEGYVRVNGKVAKSHHSTREGEELLVELPQPKKLRVEAEEIPLKIIFADNHVLVVDKPAGMVVHPGPGNYSGTLVNALLSHCHDLSGIGGVLRPGIVHRLDKDTSGLLMVAKTDAAHQALAQQLKLRRVKRKYRCLVKGVVQTDEGIVEAPVGRHPRSRQKMAVDYATGRPAATRFRVVERFQDVTLLELELATGRTHQARLHMRHLGHPVLGDRVYGVRDERINRQALHSCSLGFYHPISEKYLEFRSELPEDMRRVIEQARKDNA